MTNYYCADIIVKESYIAVHFYIFDSMNFRYVTSSKCGDFNAAFNFLFEKGISGYFKELIIYLEGPLKETDAREFLKRSIKGLNWVLTNSEINVGIVKGKFNKPAFIKINY